MKFDMSTLKDKVIAAYSNINDKFDSFCGRHPVAIRAAVAFTPTLIGMLYGSAHALADTHNITGRITADVLHSGADGVWGTSDDYWKVDVKTQDDVTHVINFYAYDTNLQTINNYNELYRTGDTVAIDYEYIRGVDCGANIYMVNKATEGCVIAPMLLGIMGIGAAISAKFRGRKKNAR